MPSRKKITFVDNPASTEYLVLDAGGRVLDRQTDLLTALAHGKQTPSATVVIGFPSGTMLARCIHGTMTEEQHAVRAIARWRKARATA